MEKSDDATGGSANGQNCFRIKKKKILFHLCLRTAFCPWQRSRFAAWLPPSAAEPVDTEPGQFPGQSEEKTREIIKIIETAFHECYLTSTIVLLCANLTDNIQLVTLGVFRSSEGQDTNGSFPRRQITFCWMDLHHLNNGRSLNQSSS